MSYGFLKRLVHTLFFVTAAATVISKCIEYNVGRGLLGTAIGPIAWWACAWPLMLSAVMMLTMGLPGGRRVVALPWRLGSDAWPLIIVLASASSSSGLRQLIPWPSILADAKIEIGVLFVLLLCLVARIVHLHFPDRFGATATGATANSGMIH